ncbi:MAG: hypothetical protein P4L76_00415 [Beijerinckiaceae bacterium]|nr:hypothetical protein [Beijerinckiaceae bacterium]
MISAIVLVPGGAWRGAARDSELLVRSLVWLVSGVVAGIVRDVTLAGPEGLGLAAIAEQSGCAVVEDDSEAGRLTKAVALSKQSRVLILEFAFQPAEGMIGELDSLARLMGPDDSARLLAAPATIWQQLFPRRSRTVGLFASASRCRALGGRDFRRLEAGLGARLQFSTRANLIF